MAEYKTPGVYIKEKNAFGTSVVEAETAIPAFIGFTEKAKLREDGDLNNVPWKISSMNEFIQYFGEAKLNIPVKIEEKDGNGSEKEYSLSVTVTNNYTLYWQMQMFFANGGGTCYVVSVKKEEKKEEKAETANEAANGSNANKTNENVPNTTNENNDSQTNANAPNTTDENDTNQTNVDDEGKEKEIPIDKLTTEMVDAALKELEKEREVTLIVVPEAALSGECGNIQQSMMKHCNDMGNRFAILDVPKDETNSPLDKRIENFQNTVTNYFSYGAAYFPWLNTTVLSDRDLTGDMFTWDESVNTFKDNIDEKAFSKIIATFCNPKESLILKTKTEGSEENTGKITKNGYTFEYGEIKNGEIKDEKNNVIGKVTNLKEETGTKTFDVEWIIAPSAVADKNAMHLALYNGSSLYKQAIQGVLKQLNLLPPSAAMAGIYTMVDHSRGVWKAPANVSLNYVDSPAEDLDDDEQANLNAPMNGKAVNVIRMFRGEGVKVWGARTLDGNSLDWRYINVRRTLLFLEESVKNAARAYVFEPNDAGTWINMKCMIENFLRSVWKRGGLAGSTPEEAFEVHVGLGDTMTGDDILEGIMRITVLVAVTHPAEFIEITFQQQMQKS